MRHFLGLTAALLAVALPHPTAAIAQRPAPATQHQRVLPLEGGQNFRDLGGYRTNDGRQVKWGLLYRSGAMNNLTDRDFAQLEARGIRTVCDFRATRERDGAPVRWPGKTKPAIFAEDYSMDRDFAGLMRPNLTGAQAADAMTQAYAQMPLRFAGQYRRMFAEMVAGRVPLAFNCSAGKDRTGIAAALVLTVLGVPQATVMEDYLLSNRYYDPRKGASGTAADDQTAAFMKRLPPDALKALMGVDRRYLDAAFATMRAQRGGFDGYLRDQLGLDAAAIRTLRARYLTRA
ncbi:tyrosine-protein phosphatase [Sphingomonas sp. CFBP 13720]|uniref:tyrosine-protein phosphatase n=1 Tax=Sphingomonas sp. CFBP 13720 TaxID=2775302 RepID=UPI00177DC415|nr:tyrosine-protein phosphatase [Sphingomonas sp. CFBP 13720]MBD8678877.1 tyrosine-protein phosphatase [Sphingomonas sp. CFBP 13720]